MEEKIKEIKKQFMALRNGIVGDVYRRAGIDCYKIIFGLNLPQMASIARSVGKDAGLAEALWNDVSVRESRLLSTWLWPAEYVTDTLTEKLLSEARTKEESDYLRLNLKK